ncbi:MAG: class I SAM-dependent methyltransferase [Fibrobacterales bacterium]
MQDNNLASNTFQHGGNFYGNVVLNPATLANIATSDEIWRELIPFCRTLAPDVYVDYLNAYYSECFLRFGKHWVYYDIVNVLYAAAKMVKPQNYLEIGVRRGRSVSTVIKASPSTNVFAFDMWQQNYAGMDNPGPEFVQNEIKKHGHNGSIQFFNGNSHETLPLFFAANPGLELDMITVDGDHTADGALQDLRDVIPHLALGGILIFDDISHPQHMYLLDVWNKAISEHGGISSFEYVESGYGVAFGIRVK